MNLRAQRAAALKAARDIIDGAEADERDLTPEETSDVQAKFAEIEDIDKKLAARSSSADLAAQLEAFGKGPADGETTPGGPRGKGDEDKAKAKSIGEHFVKELGGRSILSMQKFTTTEFKAATDTQSTGGGGYDNFLTDVDRSFALPFRRPLVVADLMGTGTVQGNSITYPVFGALEGGTGWVAQGARKPQLHVGDPIWRTDKLSEVAGFFKLTDDMAEDMPYVVSEIESTARYDLLLKEEMGLLTGDGTNNQLTGVLERSGIQVETSASTDDNADSIFRAMMKVQTATGFAADGIVINPINYQALRLRRDGNGQYYGGGFFTGAYGTGAFVEMPPLWGMPTVVTAATALNTVVVAAFQTAKVFRKGGLRVESTNSNEDDFINDKITIRLRERLGLQVKYPAAFVEVTLSTVDPV